MKTGKTLQNSFYSLGSHNVDNDTPLSDQLEDPNDSNDDFEIIAPEISEKEMLDALDLTEKAMFEKFKEEYEKIYSPLRFVASYFFSGVNTEMYKLLHPDPKDKNAPRVETWEQVKAYAYAKENEATTSRTLCDRLCAELKANYEAHLIKEEIQRKQYNDGIKKARRYLNYY